MILAPASIGHDGWPTIGPMNTLQLQFLMSVFAQDGMAAGKGCEFDLVLAVVLDGEDERDGGRGQI